MKPFGPIAIGHGKCHTTHFACDCVAERMGRLERVLKAARTLTAPVTIQTLKMRQVMDEYDELVAAVAAVEGE